MLLVIGLRAELCVDAVSVDGKSPMPYNYSMNAKILREMLDRRPFQPFEVRMSSGDVYQVRYPKIAGVTPTRFFIVDPDADDFVICNLDQIATAIFFSRLRLKAHKKTHFVTISMVFFTIFRGSKSITVVASSTRSL